jgi:hypothetical protein
MVFQSESGFVLIFVFFFFGFRVSLLEFWLVLALCAKLVPATLQLSADAQVNFTFYK